MAILVPTNNTQPLSLATSQFSSGGVMAPSPANNYNVAPINYLSNFNNPYGYSPLASSRPTQQQQGNSSFGGILGNASTLKNAGQFVQNGFQIPQSGFVNSIGSGLGFSSGGLAYSGVGPAALPWAQPGMVANSAMAGLPGVSGATGALGTTSTLSSTLGAAGIGAFAGNFLGKIGGNSTGGTIGGALGAGLGNIVAPGIGGFIGGAIGGIAGGFFGGGKPPTNASEFDGNLYKDGTISNFSYGAKNASGYSDYNTQMSKEMADYMAKIKPHLGISDFKEAFIRGGVNTKYSPSGQPGFLMVNDTVYGFDPNDMSSRQQAIGQAIAQMARESGATEEQIKTASDAVTAQSSPQGQAQTGVPFVPIKNTTKFNEFMAKYNQPTVSTQ